MGGGGDGRGAEASIGLVRGPFLNPFDMAPYMHLGPGLTPVGIAARRCFTEVDAVRLEVRRVPCPVTEVSIRHGKLLNYVPWFLGRGYWLVGLERALADCDVVNTAETYFGFSLQAARAARRLGRPLVVTVKETIPDLEGLHPLRRFGRERAVKQEVTGSASAFIAVSAAAASALRQEGVEPERITIVRPSVDTNRFVPGQPSTGEPFRILFVGPALWRKGLYDAVRALAVVRRCIDARLTIVGAGSDLGPALAVAERLGVRSAITATGRLHHAQMPAQYAAADLLLAPSIPTRTWQEQDSEAVLEAMSCGLPVVSTSLGIRRELLGAEGHFVAAGDFNEMAEAVQEIAAVPEQAAREGAILRARAVEHHDVTVIGAELSRVYRGVLR